MNEEINHPSFGVVTNTLFFSKFSRPQIRTSYTPQCSNLIFSNFREKILICHYSKKRTKLFITFLLMWFVFIFLSVFIRESIVRSLSRHRSRFIVWGMREIVEILLNELCKQDIWSPNSLEFRYKFTYKDALKVIVNCHWNT